MTQYDNAGRISKKTFLVTSVIFFIISIVFTIGRIGIRWHFKRNLAVDDAFLVFAVLCLTVSLVLLFQFISTMYLLEALITRPLSVSIPSVIFEQVTQFRTIETTFLVLSCTAIFAVKFSFLFLFKALIHNVGKMTVYWWVVTLTTAAAWAFTIIEHFLPYLNFGNELQTCMQSSEYPKFLDWSFAIRIEDILTDLMVLVIPIILLRRVKMKLQLRLALGLSLCLSIVMIIICIVKMAGIRSPTNTMDLTWGVFWQFMEACIAVIMVSSTAFRSLFVAHGSGANSPPYKPSLPKRLLTLGNVVGKKRAGESDCKETKRLPEIPHATLTGMRTLIRGGPADGSVVRGEQSGNTDDQSISVKHEMWQKSENVSPHTRTLSEHEFV